MKKLITLFSICVLSSGSIHSQCSSGAGSYDLTVTSNVVIGPSGPSFTFGIVCSGGQLMDSAMCCTRMIHVEGGGIYEAGPSAYGFVYLKSGATFDAHGNNSFFGVAYEAGATILNYTGPMNLCTAVTFPPGLCTPTTIMENNSTSLVSVYPNPCNDVLHLDNNFSKDAQITIYDIAGKKIKEIVSFDNEINVSTLSPGIYTFDISIEGQKTSRGKFAVVR